LETNPRKEGRKEGRKEERKEGRKEGRKCKVAKVRDVIGMFCDVTMLLTNTLIHVRFEVSTAVTMKYAVLWDIKTQFVLHRRHITSPLQSPAS
jgi:hypothetical protein